MKKTIIILSVFSALLFSIDANADIYIGKKGGGANGYKTIDESHQGNVHTLECFDPGNESCTWTTKPYITTSVGQYDVDNIAAQVEGNITNQVYQGNFTLDNEYIVSWIGQATNNYDMSIVPIN